VATVIKSLTDDTRSTLPQLAPLFPWSPGRRDARHGDCARGAVEADVGAIDLEVHRTDVGGNRVASGAIQALQVGRAGFALGSPPARLRLTLPNSFRRLP
jgi:hypothetical protein